jgi:hypothetical protein
MTLICLLVAWGLSFSAFAVIVIYCSDGWKYLRQLHRIPCSKCQYFCDSRYLKCTVFPDKACTELAIDCADFRPQCTTVRQQRREKQFIHTL